jgi:dienelactone hydrolase
MLLTTALLLTAAAVAPAPLPEAFEITVGGVSYGTEEFHRTEGADGVSLTGKASLKVPGMGDAVLTQEAKLARDGHPLSYTLDANVPEQQSVVRVVTTETGFKMSATARGSTEPARTQAVDVKASVFLLDNNFASHIDALTRTLNDLTGGAERSITALVPQVMVALAATVKRGPDGTASQGGASVATRSYRLTYAGLATDLIVRADDGALLDVEVPAQNAILRRRGFVPAAAPLEETRGPSVDPRESPTEVKGPAIALPAALLIPASQGPVPVVVFLSGSGPNDKDETIGPNKPFADMARGLGDRGIASLRFDKRTFAIKDKRKLEGVLLKDEYYDDAKAAIALVAQNPKLDRKRIFVVGHSEGAMVAPIVAAGSPETRGIVMLAPGVRPIDAVLIDQASFGAKLTGRSAAETAETTKQISDAFAAIRDPKATDAPPFRGASAAYWRELLALDVPKLVESSKLPILVLQGEKDFQVRKDLDFDLLRSRAGEAGGRVTYRSFPDLNHLFMRVEHASTGAEYAIPGHVEPSVISAIADWILSR